MINYLTVYWICKQQDQKCNERDSFHALLFIIKTTELSFYTLQKYNNLWIKPILCIKSYTLNKIILPHPVLIKCINCYVLTQNIEALLKLNLELYNPIRQLPQALLLQAFWYRSEEYPDQLLCLLNFHSGSDKVHPPNWWTYH